MPVTDISHDLDDLTLTITAQFAAPGGEAIGAPVAGPAPGGIVVGPAEGTERLPGAREPRPALLRARGTRSTGRKVVDTRR